MNKNTLHLITISACLCGVIVAIDSGDWVTIGWIGIAILGQMNLISLKNRERKG